MSRREEILDVAERLLEHYGVQKTTMQDIAREADVGVGTVYLEFDSKTAIIEALARKRHERILNELREAAESGRTFEDRLQAFLDARYNAFLRHGTSGAHAHELVHCACVGADKAWEVYHRKERAILCQMLERAASDGEADIPEPEVACEAIFRIYTTFSPPHLFDADDRRLRVMKEVHHIVLRGLVRRG
jgi:AcrR family transcriptional regulator